MKKATDTGPAPAGGRVAPEIEMLRLASGHLAAQAIHVFAVLGVADLLRDGPKNVEEIARLTRTNGPVLHRVLRFLATLGVVSEGEGARFALTSLGRTQCSRPTSVIRDNTLLVASRCYWASIGALLHAVQTGQSAFRHVHGQEFFEYLTEHPEDAEVFHAAMDSSSAIGVAAIVSSYDFSVFRRIVDLAGGRGALLTEILKRNPSARGVLYEAAGIHERIDIDAAVADRLTREEGSLFDSVPAGGDAYILRRVLHDWDDGQTVEILRRCRTAMRSEARLLIIELAAPDGDRSASDWAAMDLLMMLVLNGRERTAAELERLLGAAGFSLARVVRTPSPYWIIEAVPA